MILHLWVWVGGIDSRDGKGVVWKRGLSVGGRDSFTFVTGVVEDVCVMETWNPAKAASWNQAPKLHYCLQYDQQKAELFVTHLEGKLSVDVQGRLWVCLPGGAAQGG